MKKLVLLPLLFFLLESVTGVAQAADDSCPCCSENYRDFDFWLGNWEAFGPKGKLAGTNNIVVLHDGCVIQENWSSGGGKYTGTSYNYFDAISGEWNQVWVDNGGGSLQLKGGWTGETMVLSSGPIAGPEGTITISRITWTPNVDRTVRQVWDISKDDGQSWNTVFDGMYKKKEQ